MSKAKHSPGKWFFDGDTPANQGFDVCTQDGGVLATAYYNVDRDEYSVQRAEANARLIAAVPEMLEALKEILAHECQEQPCGHCAAVARRALSSAGVRP